MTKEEKTQKIREKINEACPELMELSFGCEVKEITYKLKIEGDKEVLREKIFTIYDKNYEFDGERFNAHGVVYIENSIQYPSIKNRMFVVTTVQDYENVRFEILGKPPTLEHLLRAIGINYTIHADGIFAVDAYNQMYEHITYYDLTKSPLEQSDEVTDSIYKLLCE